jgi:hypothetical protein
MSTAKDKAEKKKAEQVPSSPFYTLETDLLTP